MSNESPNTNNGNGGSSMKRKYREAFSETPNTFDGLEASKNFSEVSSTDAFLNALEKRDSKDMVTVLMGYSPGVDACQQMNSYVNHLASKFQNVTFIKADMTKLEDISETQKISVMPTFVIYRNGKPEDKIEGAFPEVLKASLCRLTKRDPKELQDDDDDSLPKGSEDLIHYINLKKSECRNSSEEHSFEGFCARKNGIESDVDEQLLISYGFNQDIVLHGFKIKAPEEEGPLRMKIFINQLTSMDFDDAESTTPAQDIKLSREDNLGHNVISLERTKFKKVSNVTFFISENQGGGDVTKIQRLTLLGEPLDKKKGVAGHTTSIVTLD